MNVDITKRYKTRTGKDVRLFATDILGFKPILGVIKDTVDHESTARWYANGNYDNYPSHQDLVEVPKQIEIEVWNYGASNTYIVVTPGNLHGRGEYFKGSFKVDLPSEFGDVK